MPPAGASQCSSTGEKVGDQGLGDEKRKVEVESRLRGEMEEMESKIHTKVDTLAVYVDQALQEVTEEPVYREVRGLAERVPWLETGLQETSKVATNCEMWRRRLQSATGKAAPQKPPPRRGGQQGPVQPPGPPPRRLMAVAQSKASRKAMRPPKPSAAAPPAKAMPVTKVVDLEEQELVKTLEGLADGNMSCVAASSSSVKPSCAPGLHRS